MTRASRRPWLLGLLGLAAWAGLAEDARAQKPSFPLDIMIPDSTGRHTAIWWGGDAASGAMLGNGMSFWAFSDTFTSPLGQLRQDVVGRLVGNTIAIGQNINGAFKPYYFYKGTPGSPLAFFSDPGPGYRFWTSKAVMVGGKLFVFLSLRDSSSNAAATYIARVNNPLDIPIIWSIDYIPVYPGATLQMGSEAIPYGDSLIVFGYYGYTSVCFLLSNAGLLNTPNGTFFPNDQAQYLSADANNANWAWEPGLGGLNAQGYPNYYNSGLDPYAFTGFTIRFNPSIPPAGAWQQVCFPNAASPYVYVIAGQSPLGPWNSAPLRQPIFQLPEYILKYPSPDDSTSSVYDAQDYGTREWVDPIAANNAEILFTYTRSSSDQAVVDGDYWDANHFSDGSPYDLYRIKSVVVTNPLVTGAPAQLISTNAIRRTTAVAPSPLAPAGPPPSPFASPGSPKPRPFPAYKAPKEPTHRDYVRLPWHRRER